MGRIVHDQLEGAPQGEDRARVLGFPGQQVCQRLVLAGGMQLGQVAPAHQGVVGVPTAAHGVDGEERRAPADAGVGQVVRDGAVERYVVLGAEPAQQNHRSAILPTRLHGGDPLQLRLRIHRVQIPHRLRQVPQRFHAPAQSLLAEPVEQFQDTMPAQRFYPLGGVAFQVVHQRGLRGAAEHPSAVGPQGGIAEFGGHIIGPQLRDLGKELLDHLRGQHRSFQHKTGLLVESVVQVGVVIDRLAAMPDLSQLLAEGAQLSNQAGEHLLQRRIYLDQPFLFEQLAFGGLACGVGGAQRCAPRPAPDAYVDVDDDIGRETAQDGRPGPAALPQHLADNDVGSGRQQQQRHQGQDGRQERPPERARGREIAAALLADASVGARHGVLQVLQSPGLPGMFLHDRPARQLDQGLGAMEAAGRRKVQQPLRLSADMLADLFQRLLTVFQQFAVHLGQISSPLMVIAHQRRFGRPRGEPGDALQPRPGPALAPQAGFPLRIIGQATEQVFRGDLGALQEVLGLGGICRFSCPQQGIGDQQAEPAHAVFAQVAPGQHLRADAETGIGAHAASISPFPCPRLEKASGGCGQSVVETLRHGHTDVRQPADAVFPLAALDRRPQQEAVSVPEGTIAGRHRDRAIQTAELAAVLTVPAHVVVEFQQGGVGVGLLPHLCRPLLLERLERLPGRDCQTALHAGGAPLAETGQKQDAVHETEHPPLYAGDLLVLHRPDRLAQEVSQVHHQAPRQGVGQRGDQVEVGAGLAPRLHFLAGRHAPGRRGDGQQQLLDGGPHVAVVFDQAGARRRPARKVPQSPFVYVGQPRGHVGQLAHFVQVGRAPFQGQAEQVLVLLHPCLLQHLLLRQDQVADHRQVGRHPLVQAAADGAYHLQPLAAHPNDDRPADDGIRQPLVT